MSHAGSFVIGSDHPSLPGHFPGRPIVPGVIVLDESIALILQRLPGNRLTGLANVKFLAPISPDRVVVVSYEQIGTDRVTFACAVDGHDVARGSLRVGRFAASRTAEP